jgi:hypothetical protein
MFKVKKLFMKIGVSVLAVLGVVGLANNVHAAADPDLTSALASTSLIFTDNKSTIFTFLVGAFAVALVIGIALRAMNRGGGMVKGSLGGGKRRR